MRQRAFRFLLPTSVSRYMTAAIATQDIMSTFSQDGMASGQEKRRGKHRLVKTWRF